MRIPSVALVASTLLAWAGAPLAAQAPQPAKSAAPTYDLILKGGRVLDGTGNPWYYADVAVSGDHIAAVGDLGDATAKRVIDAHGLYVTPGFIDVHSHAASGLASAELSHGEPLLAQGITTIVGNPDGGGPTDLVAQRAKLESHPLGPNVALAIGHNSVRGAVLGMQDRDPTPAELDRMRELVKTAMEAGAFGLSDGPYYAPGSYSKTPEIVALAKIAAQYGGVYQSHIRDESDYTIGLPAAVDEVITISREAKIPALVDHIKALGPDVWGYSNAIVEKIDRARAEGLQVYADQYPYEASGTSITGALVPRWAQASTGSTGKKSGLQAVIADPVQHAKLRADMLENFRRRGGAERLQISEFRPDPSIEGKTLAEVAKARGVEPVDLAIDLLKQGGAGLVSFNMDERDIATFMQQPWTMTCTDGGLVPMNQGVPHPRFYGAFPRKIRKYVEEENVITLPVAIHSMTGLPAQVYHMDDRGRIEAGRKADILVFDLPRVKDTATYQKPHQLAEGMVYILVNGGLEMDNGQFTDVHTGRVLSRRPAGKV